MTIDAIAVDATPRERRTAVLAGRRVIEVRHERPGAGPRVGESWLGRVGRVAQGVGGAFIDLGAGGEAFLKVVRGAPAEGAWLAVEVVAEAHDDKSTRVRRADAATAIAGPPRRLAEAPPEPIALLRAEAGVTRLVVDGYGLAGPARRWVEAAGRKDVAVEVWTGPGALFDERGIDAALERALGARFALDGGGALGIEEGKALTVIDVDSAGRATGDATARAVNLAAAMAIPGLLRLRRIGGLVVVDFVGMRQVADRRAVMARLREGLANDPLVTACNGLSALGLAEIARRRLGPSLWRAMSEPCGVCADGRVASARSVADAAARRVMREAAAGRGGAIELACGAAVARALDDPACGGLAALEHAVGRLGIAVRDDWPADRFEVTVPRP